MRICSHSELENFPQLDWPAVAPHMQPDLRASVERVLELQDGEHLSREQCLTIANAEGDDLLGVVVAADLLRCELAGKRKQKMFGRDEGVSP